MKKILLIGLSLLGVLTATTAQDRTALRQQQFNLEKGLALQGYDPVSYFTKNKSEKGKSEYVVKADGIVYRFASAENKQLFLKNPAAYEPQYGGWCAYAMGKSGEKVEIDPDTFKIINGKLYLFYNAFFNNTLKSWNKDERSLQSKADNNWKKFIH